MPPTDAVVALKPVVAVLDGLGVKHFIGGSVASAAYGRPRTTVDVDLVADLRRQHVAPLVTALETDYYVSARAAAGAVAQKSCFNLIHLATALKVDVFVLKGRKYDLAALARRRRDTIDADDPGSEFMLASPEDLVLSKLEWYRPGNEVSQQQWRDVIGLLQVQGGALDDAYIDQWAADLGVADLLAKARQEAQ
jgi:hypothetical protein